MTTAQEKKLGSDIIFSASGIDIVVSPFLVGEPLEKLALQSSIDFIKYLNTKYPLDKIKVCPLDILMGGRYYQLPKALKTCGFDCTPVEVRAKRSLVDDKWCVKIWHDKKASTVTEEQTQKRLSEADIVIIGDTVATGTTLKGVINHVGNIRKDKPCDLYIFTIAGSDFAETNIKECAHLFKSINIVYANAKFFLNANGTDLEFKKAKYHPKAEDIIKKKLNGFEVGMKCAIWDWGDRFTNIEHHVKEVKEYFETVKDAPKYILEGFNLPTTTVG